MECSSESRRFVDVGLFFIINFIYTGEALVHSSFLGRSSADGTRVDPCNLRIIIIIIQVGITGGTDTCLTNSIRRVYVQVTYGWEHIYTVIQLCSLNLNLNLNLSLSLNSLSSCKID